MSEACVSCTELITTRKPGLQCNACASWFHQRCSGISSTNWKLLSRSESCSWECDECLKRKKGSSRKSIIPGIVDVDDDEDPTPDDTSVPQTLAVLLSEFREMKRDFKDMHTIKSDIGELKNCHMEIISSLNFLSGKIDDFEAKMSEMAKKVKQVDKLEGLVNDLTRTVSTLESRLDGIDQANRADNLQIDCVPESRNENIPAMVQKLCVSIGCPIQPGEVEHCHRVQKINQESARPRSIIVKLVSRLKRDELLAAAKAKRNSPAGFKPLLTSDLGLPGSLPIYLGEHLTPRNKRLFLSARDAAKRSGFKFVWVRDGKILARRNETSRAFQVVDEKDLEKFAVAVAAAATSTPAVNG